MADEIIIRKCRGDEGQAVLDLWQQAGDVVVSPTDSLKDIQAAINHSAALFLVAESQDRIMGTLISTWDGWRGEFYRLAVSPEVRRRGVARILVDTAEKWMAEQGCHRITALVEKDHPWATGFWTALGYELHESMSRYFRDV
ncbi:MAG: GNAT family N-acetyltransferase [Planctomyces sp.]|jgi:ribosomal protein S18 acetylase RimI-like enzyme|nr:GNAT family N-acetyltransferase [Planctomyces sp.]